MRTWWLTGALALAIAACGGNSDGDLFSDVPDAGNGGTNSGGSASGGSGGSTASGGNSSGGNSSGGNSSGSGGNSSGSGGTQSAGGSQGSGGANDGGSAGTGSGGQATGGSGGNASGGGAHAGSGQGGTMSGGSGGRGGSGGTPSCDELIDAAYDALAKARACDPNTDVPHCQHFVEDPCGCSVPIENPDSEAAKAYSAAYERMKKNGCSIVCLAIICPDPKGGTCYPNGSC